jgi:SHS2 domain-containing protein
MAKKYEILDHRADLKIRVFGKTKEELFLNMLLGMNAGLRPETNKQMPAKRNIYIHSQDFSTLLVDFLNEVLYLIQVHKEVYTNLKFIKFTNKELKAELLGQKVESFGEDIKAATYHDLDIHQREDGIWEATVLFDI